jgi:hypothetical protein
MDSCQWNIDSRPSHARRGGNAITRGAGYPLMHIFEQSRFKCLLPIAFIVG